MSVPMRGDIGLSFDSEVVRKTYDAWGDPLASPARGDVKSVYSRTVRGWGYRCPELATDALVRAIRAGAVRLPTRGARFLDVGCGDGLQAESLKSAGLLAGEDVRLCGMDISERLLAVARGAGRYHALVCDDLNRCDANVEVDVATARFENDAFHVSFCVGVLTYVDPDAYAGGGEGKNRRNLLRELARVSSEAVIFTCRTDMCAPWERAAQALVDEGVWRPLEPPSTVPYLPGNASYHDKGVEARLFAFAASEPPRTPRDADGPARGLNERSYELS